MPGSRPATTGETTVSVIHDHHPGYISWEQYERNQAMIAANSKMQSRMLRKAGRGGRALLSGMLRCRRCGRMLQVVYSGTHGTVPRCRVWGAQINHGEDWCISFGGLRVDEALAHQVLDAISGDAVASRPWRLLSNCGNNASSSAENT